MDRAFVSLPAPRSADIELTDLAHSVLDLVVPGDHPLACRTSVPIGELAGLDLIDAPVGYGNRTVADRAFAAAGVSRQASIEIPDIATGADFVRHNLGIALLPRFIFGQIRVWPR